MERWWTARSWPPYVVGALLGMLSWFAFATVDRGLGVTSFFEQVAAFALSPLLEDGARHAGYYADPQRGPKLDWEWTLVVGVLVGAWVSARWSGDRTKEAVPALWRDRFGASAPLRFAAAFVGGAVMMFGARMAQGCTSGHAITGALQLAVSSWAFAITFFLVAIGTTHLLYGRAEVARG